MDKDDERIRYEAARISGQIEAGVCVISVVITIFLVVTFGIVGLIVALLIFAGLRKLGLYGHPDLPKD